MLLRIWIRCGVVAGGLCRAASVFVEPRSPAESSVPDGTRPNILWITAEDMSPNLGCYGDRYATTPNLDKLAERGVRYTHAFATAPVCSPARSCLITGMYATSLGTANLRSAFPIPSHVRGFPAYLRKQAGYFCTNNQKTDYNTAQEPQLIQASWDECSGQAHWRHRKSGQPFFSVFNLMVTHQSRTSAWPYDEFERMIEKELQPDQRHDPAQAPVPPFYPDTPIVRRSLARYYDCLTAMDRQAGQILDQLDADGLSENTIVFFYGDNGMGMPRGKRTLYDSGLHEPLIIYFPEKFRHLAPAPAGQVVERLVSFVDFAPTVLSLAGLPVPEYMQGTAFLGQVRRERPASTCTGRGIESMRLMIWHAPSVTAAISISVTTGRIGHGINRKRFPTRPRSVRRLLDSPRAAS